MNQRLVGLFLSPEEAKRNFKNALSSDRKIKNALYFKVDRIDVHPTKGDTPSILSADWSLPKIRDSDNMLLTQKDSKNAVPSP